MTVGYSLEKAINKIPTTNGDGVSWPDNIDKSKDGLYCQGELLV